MAETAVDSHERKFAKPVVEIVHRMRSEHKGLMLH